LQTVLVCDGLNGVHRQKIRAAAAVVVVLAVLGVSLIVLLVVATDAGAVVNVI